MTVTPPHSPQAAHCRRIQDADARSVVPSTSSARSRRRLQRRAALGVRFFPIISAAKATRITRSSASALNGVCRTVISTPVGLHTSLGGNLRNISTDAQHPAGCASEYTRASRQPARVA